MLRIIGMCGYAQTGKDTAAEVLQNYTRVAFADRLKFEAEQMLAGQGIHVTLADENEKKKYRDLLIAWGKIRRSFDENYWIKWVAMKILTNQENRYIITDVRYPNEVKWILNKGGMVIRVNRPGVGPINEEEQETIRKIDMLYNLPVVINDGSKKDYEKFLRRIIHQSLTNSL